MEEEVVTKRSVLVVLSIGKVALLLSAAAFSVCLSMFPVVERVFADPVGELDRFYKIELPGEDEVRGEPPTPKEVEEAFNECLRTIDEEVGEMGTTNAHRHTHRESQTAMCRQNKNSCIMKPRGAECRAFIEDYAIESVM
jgi:hypothetical protein